MTEGLTFAAVILGTLSVAALSSWWRDRGQR